VAELSIVPPLYVTRAISAQRKARPLPVAQREAALSKAADIFVNSVIAGLDFEQYVDLVSRVSGLPIAVARVGARDVAGALTAAFDAVRPAQPTGAAFDWREERTRTGTAVWARRGEVFAARRSGERADGDQRVQRPPPHLRNEARDPARRLPGRLPDAQQRLHPRLRAERHANSVSTSDRLGSGLVLPRPRGIPNRPSVGSAARGISRL
jgi:hypothetical protein